MQLLLHRLHHVLLRFHLLTSVRSTATLQIRFPTATLQVHRSCLQLRSESLRLLLRVVCRFRGLCGLREQRRVLRQEDAVHVALLDQLSDQSLLRLPLPSQRSELLLHIIRRLLHSAVSCLLLQEADAPQKPLIACNQLVQVGEENISIRRVRRRIDPLSHHADQLFLRVLRDLLQRNHAVAQPRHLTAQLFHLLRPVRQLVHLTVVESGETLLPRA